VGPRAVGNLPHVAVARHVPPVALEEANQIARQIVEALADAPTSTGAPIGAVRLKTMVIERNASGEVEGGLVVEERVRAATDPGMRNLPIAEPEELPAIVGAEEDPVALVVDDDEAIRVMLTRALEHDGITVLQAASGDEAVSILRLMRPNVVLLDAMLPQVHGFEICAALKRSQLKDLPVIMISAVYRGWEHAREIQETHGADYFVEKPFEIQYIRKLVAEVLRRPHVAPPRPDLLARSIEDARCAYEEHAAHGLFMAADADVQLWISLDPFDGRAWLERGNLCALGGDLVGAMSAYEAAVVYDARLLIAHLGLAMIYEQLGFQKRARATWAKARDLAPDDVTRASIDKHLR
jgi:CheY-like chemotaxis protein